jgi:hypothetical protein
MSPIAVLGIISGIILILWVLCRDTKKDTTIDTITDFYILDMACDLMNGDLDD